MRERERERERERCDPTERQVPEFVAINMKPVSIVSATALLFF